MRNEIKILEATIVIVVKYGSKAWVFQKPEKDLLKLFHGQCLRMVLDNGQIIRCAENGVVLTF